MLLAGCDEFADNLPGTLPPPPADVRLCFRSAGVEIPDRAITKGEVEHYWKQDRVRAVAMGRCGTRLLAWYEQLRSDWK